MKVETEICLKVKETCISESYCEMRFLVKNDIKSEKREVLFVIETTLSLPKRQLWEHY